MNELRIKLNDIEKRKTAIENDIKAQVLTRLTDNVALKTALAALENSTEYASDEYGFYTWTRFDAKSCIDVKDSLEVDALREYLFDFAANVDLKNDALTLNIGDCIAVDADDHSVYDQSTNKEIIKKNKKPLAVIKRAVEMYQNKRGEFGAVLLVDRYGSQIKAI